MKKYSFYLSFLILISLNSCEYPLNEEYYRDVKPPDSANIQVILDPLETTYFLSGISTFTYKAIMHGYTLYEVSVFVDSTNIKTFSEINGYFTLDCRDYTDGKHTLTVVATTNSATGSIADLVGAEGFILSGSWDLIVDKSPPTPVQITNIFDAGGLLKVEWDSYTKGNFGRYEVLKNYTSSWGDSRTVRMAFINNPDRNFFYDSSYLGGNVSYFVRVLTPMDKAATSETKSHSEAVPVFNIEWITDSKIRVYWEKLKYYKAFSSLIVTIDSWSDEIVIKNPETTEFTGDFGIFGVELNYKFCIVPQRADLSESLYSSKKHAIGYPFPKYQQFRKNNVNDEVILSNWKKIYRYNVATSQLLDSLLYTDDTPDLMLSPGGDVMLEHYFYFNRINPVTLAVTPIPGVTLDCENLSASSYGLARISSFPVLYDFKNLKVIDTLSSISYMNEKFISEDNKYVFKSAGTVVQCFAIENGQLILKWENPKNDFMLIPGSPDKIMILYNKMLEIRDVSSNQVLLSFPVDGTQLIDIDRQSKQVVCYDYTNWTQIYNYETGLKTSNLRIGGGLFALKNGIMYSGSGYYLPL